MTLLDKVLTHVFRVFKVEDSYDTHIMLEDDCYSRHIFKRLHWTLWRIELITADEYYHIRHNYGYPCYNWNCSLCH